MRIILIVDNQYNSKLKVGSRVILKFDLVKSDMLSTRILVVFLVTVFEVTAQKPGDRLICLGSDFVTKLVNAIFDRSRASIAMYEPNRIGGRSDHIGLFVSNCCIF